MNSSAITPTRAGVYLLVLASVALLAFAAILVLSLGVGAPMPWMRPLGPTTVGVLLGFAEVTVGVLGVAVTVVSILVELAANRYTPRIAELFVRDRTNVLVLSVFVLTSLLVVWVALSLGEEAPAPGLVAAMVVLQSTSLLALLPYFAYVFDFLGPERVVQRIAGLALAANTDLRHERSARHELAQALDQLGDLAHRAIQAQDRTLAAAAVHALGDVTVELLEHKASHGAVWFDSQDLLASDADFASFHPDVLRRFVERRTWAEAKALRQFHALYGACLAELRDTAHLIAIACRRIAHRAAILGDGEALRLTLRFLHSFLRAAVNARDVRSAYNAMQEMRLLAESLVHTPLQGQIVGIAVHMRTYGVLAFRSRLSFVLETVAYDLAELLEHLHAAGAPEHDAVLAVLLEVDRESDEEGAQEAALRGVRKAQVKLGTYYLASGDVDRAVRIRRDLHGESPLRLALLRSELESTVDAEYWEISDRPTNFDWLSPERRALLDAFFLLPSA